MKKKYVSLLAAGAVVMGAAGAANATLTTIGTATYNGLDYNLIYAPDSPMGPITWLDYTNPITSWDNQVNWAAGLGSQLTVTLNPGYTTTIDWSTGWRLPATVDGLVYWGYDGTTTAGFNITSSEMGHLFYEELGNLGWFDTSGNGPQPGWGLQHTGDFDNLIASSYWSGTELACDPGFAWAFQLSYGQQFDNPMDGTLYGLAVRSGQVSEAPVPEPATILLMGTGIAGLAGLRRRREGSRV